MDGKEVYTVNIKEIGAHANNLNETEIHVIVYN